MKKRIKKNWLLAHKKIVALIAGLSILLLIGLYFAVGKMIYINDAANQASMVQIRDLILMAVGDLKKDVPVEAKTGDIYFPESRLYLPNPKAHHKLSYSWLAANEDIQEELSVSLTQVPGTTGLYSARNINQMFDAVPKLQACSRGVKLVYNKFPADDTQNQLKHTVSLRNDKELYIYVERDCPELNDVADLLKNIRAY